MKITAKDIALEAIILAIYFGITILTFYFSFGVIQFRIAEMLIILVFFNKKHTIGITLGCLIANIASSLGFFDIIFGTLATLASCLIVCFIKKLALGLCCTVLINAFVVGSELFYVLKEPFWMSVGFVALGEFVVLAVGYLLMMLVFKKRQHFYPLINANQNIDFVW